MNREYLTTSLEITYIRARAKLAFAIQLVGMLAVFLAIYNMFLIGTVETTVWFGYRGLFDATAMLGEGMNTHAIHVADMGLFAAGAALVWWA